MGFKKNIFKTTWVLKSLVTIFGGQIGIIVLLVFVGPSKNISFITSLTNYLTKGSLLLSSLSIGATLISLYLFDEREEGKELIFEISKGGMLWIIIAVLSAGISYAIFPSNPNWYFMCLQFLCYLFLIYWIFKINHIIHNKESYSKVMDETGKRTMESARKVTKHNGIDF